MGEHNADWATVQHMLQGAAGSGGIAPVPTLWLQVALNRVAQLERRVEQLKVVDQASVARVEGTIRMWKECAERLQREKDNNIEEIHNLRKICETDNQREIALTMYDLVVKRNQTIETLQQCNNGEGACSHRKMLKETERAMIRNAGQRQALEEQHRAVITLIAEEIHNLDGCFLFDFFEQLGLTDSQRATLAVAGPHARKKLLLKWAEESLGTT